MKKLTSIPSCENCMAHGSTIFKSLTKDELMYVNYEKGCSLHKRNDIVFHEGSRVSGFYCVNKGVVKLYKTGGDGREQIIRFAQKGDIFGYRSILSGEPSSTTAEVIEDAVICFIPSSMLFNTVKENSSFAMDVMQLACKELGEANKYILNIAQKTVRERLAEALLILKETFGLDKESFIQVSLTREELASIVGTATESIIRLLSEFKDEAIVELNGRRIKILNNKLLVKVANVFD